MSDGLRTPVKVMSVDEMADRIEELEAKLAKVKASYRKNMMQAYPAYTHEQFDKDYEEMMGGKDER